MKLSKFTSILEILQMQLQSSGCMVSAKREEQLIIVKSAI